MEETNIEAVDSVKNNEEVEVVAEESSNEEALKARIAELEEVAKTKAIEARLAKKEKAAPQKVDGSLLERVTRMELKDLGLKDDAEIDLVKKEALELGVDPIILVKKGLAEGMLTAHRKALQDELATPGTSSRATGSTRDTVEYWIAKGELPPKDQVELRQKVVRKKRDNAKKAQMFNH